MKSLRIISSTVLFGILILSACQEDKIIGGDPCEYISFSDTVFITKLFINEDYSIGNVSFQSLDSANEYSYEVSQHELSYLEKNFTLESLNIKKGKFLVEGQRAISGTCVPYTIGEITLLK